MDKFDQAEQSGRELFKSILDQCQITDYKESTEKYDTLDLYCSIKEKTAGIEIKKRDKQYENYSTYLMELYKYNALINRLNEGELNSIYYANFFGDDVVYIFSLRNIARAIKEDKVQITTTYANRTTSVFGGKVEKQILLLPKELATKLVRVEGKWYNPNKINNL